MIISVWIVAHNMFGSVLHKLGMDLEGANGLMGLATGSAVMLGAGIGAVGVASVRAATEYQTQFARIQGLTGSTQQQLDYYNKTLIQTSANYDMTATDAAKALYFIISAGLFPLSSALDQAKQNMDVLKYSSMSATASLADQANVADAMTSMMKAYADSNLTAADAANTLTRIEVYGKAQLGSFAASLGFMMVTAHAAGLSVHEASAALANLTQVAGNHGSRRMINDLDNLMRSLLSIDDVSKRTAKELKSLGVDDASGFRTIDMRAKDLGITFDKLKYSGMDFIGKLKYLAEISGYSAAQYNQSRNTMIIKQYQEIAATKSQAEAQAWLNMQQMEGSARFMKMIGGAAAFIPALTLLTQHGQTYNDILTQMNSKTDIVTDAFNNMRNTFGQTVKMFEMRLQSVLIVIGQNLLPALTNFGKQLIQVVTGMLAFVQSSDGMEKIKNTVMGLGVIIATFLLPPLAGLLIAQIPITLMLIAMTKAGYELGQALSKHPEIIGKVQHAFTDLWGKVQPLLAQLAQALHDTFTNPTLIGALHNLWTAIQGLGPVVQLIAMAVGVTLYAAFQVLIGAIQLAGPILTTVADGFALVLTAVGKLANWITSNEDVFTAFKAILIGISVALLQLAIDAGITFVAGLIEMIPYILLSTAMLWGMATAVIAATWPFLLAAAAIAALAFGIMELVQHWTQVKAFFENIGRAAGDAAHAILNTVNDLGNRVTSLFADQHRKVADESAIQRDRMAIIADQQRDAVVRAAISQHMRALNEAVKQRNDILAQLAATRDGAARIALEQQLQVVNHHVAMEHAAVNSAMQAHVKIVAHMQHTKQDLQSHVKDLQQNVTHIWSTFWGHLGDTVHNFVANLGTNVHNGLAHVGDLFKTGFAKIGEILHNFATLTPAQIEHAVGFAIGFLWALPIRGAEILGQFVWNALTAFGKFQEDAVSALGRMKDQALAVLGNFKDQAIAKSREMVTNLFLTFARLVTEVPQKIQQTAEKFQLQMIAWGAQVVLKAVEMRQSLLDEWNKLPDQMKALGKSIWAGLVNGLKSAWQGAVDAAKNLASGLLDGVKHALGIHSPSQKFFEVGTYMIQGLINGFRSIDLAGAWLAHTAVLSQPFTATASYQGAQINAGGISGAGGGLWGTGSGGGGGGGTHIHNHNWTGAFPGVRSGEEIAKAVTLMEQDTYRKTRRGGSYGGLHADS